MYKDALLPSGNSLWELRVTVMSALCSLSPHLGHTYFVTIPQSLIPPSSLCCFCLTDLSASAGQKSHSIFLSCLCLNMDSIPFNEWRFSILTPLCHGEPLLCACVSAFEFKSDGGHERARNVSEETEDIGLITCKRNLMCCLWVYTKCSGLMPVFIHVGSDLMLEHVCSLSGLACVFKFSSIICVRDAEQVHFRQAFLHHFQLNNLPL